MNQLLNIRLHLFVIVIAIIAESIGIHVFDLGIGKVVLLPLLFSFLIAILLNPYIISSFEKIIPKSSIKAAGRLVTIAVMPFIAKFSLAIGPKLPEIIAAGPALLLQEIGNLATMLFALPFAVLVLKMGRESIGATHSIAREPNVALISDKYGLNSAEGIGVMGVYVIGTLVGSIFFSLMAGFLASTEWLDIRALAMACGVGSGSMTAACSGALIAVQPEFKESINAFAATSNVMTYATGLYMSLFIALPLCEFMYKKLAPKHDQKAEG